MPKVVEWPTLEKVHRYKPQHNHEVEDLCSPNELAESSGGKNPRVKKKDGCFDQSESDCVHDFADEPNLKSGVDLPKFLVPQWVSRIELDLCNFHVRLCYSTLSSLI